LLRSTIAAISTHPELRLQLVVTGTHLLKAFGHTIDDIVRDGRRIDARVRMQRGDDRPLDQAEGLSRGVAGIARFLQRAKTDIVVVLGDRIEAMAGALAGVTTGRLVAHIHGGDVAPGDFDDSLRHAITKLAHLHLTATEAARRRVISMGENPVRVHCVGAPGLDRLLEVRSAKFEVQSSRKHDRSLTVAARYGVATLSDESPALSFGSPRGLSPTARKALIVQHPCGRSAAVERRVMQMILGAVSDEGLRAVCLYPNSDRGHGGIIAAIEAHAGKANGAFRFVPSLDHDRYLRLLIGADLLIGNSSSGIIEAAAAGTPAVDVGSRQAGRERDHRWVVHAEENPSSIRSALREALRLRPIRRGRGAYGNGGVGWRIAALLAAIPLHDAFRRKVFRDVPETRNWKPGTH
jgi:UDP-hydrolysing UDP-N-acetyl-D-glucosamine 2-epimerase